MKKTRANCIYLTDDLYKFNTLNEALNHAKKNEDVQVITEKQVFNVNDGELKDRIVWKRKSLDEKKAKLPEIVKVKVKDLIKGNYISESDLDKVKNKDTFNEVSSKVGDYLDDKFKGKGTWYGFVITVNNDENDKPIEFVCSGIEWDDPIDEELEKGNEEKAKELQDEQDDMYDDAEYYDDHNQPEKATNLRYQANELQKKIDEEVEKINPEILDTRDGFSLVRDAKYNNGENYDYHYIIVKEKPNGKKVKCQELDWFDTEEEARKEFDEFFIWNMIYDYEWEMDRLNDDDDIDERDYKKLVDELYTCRTEDEMKAVLEKTRQMVEKNKPQCPEGFEEFCGYLNDPYQKIDVGTEIITKDGEHLYVTDIVDDNIYLWVSNNKRDIETGRGANIPKHIIRFVSTYNDYDESLTEKKSKKKKDKVRFVGDMNKEISFFNRAMGNQVATADGGVGSVSVGEDMKSDYKKVLDKHNIGKSSIVPNTKEEWNDLKHISDKDGWDKDEPNFTQEFKKDVKKFVKKNKKFFECDLTESWKSFDKYNDLINKYMLSRGEGNTKASQCVTAVNKLVYKWFNDGDVYDNTSFMRGWVNDLSSYANWLWTYVPESHASLKTIRKIRGNDNYEALLKNLCDSVINEQVLDKLEQEEKQGSIYDCDGPFAFIDKPEREWSDDYEGDMEHYKQKVRDWHKQHRLNKD